MGFVLESLLLTLEGDHSFSTLAKCYFSGKLYERSKGMIRKYLSKEYGVFVIVGKYLAFVSSLFNFLTFMLPV